jgi:glycosyltransferase involved in cell wall biosynthesis
MDERKNIMVIAIRCNPVLKSHLDSMGKEVDLLYSGRKSNVRSMLCVMRALMVNSPHIFCYNLSVFNMLVFIGKRIFTDTELSYHLHDPVAHSGWKNPIINLLNRLMVASSHRIYVYSATVKGQVDLLYKHNNVEVVQHGFKGFRYGRTDIADKDEVVIGFFGRNMPHKNFDMFLEFIRKHNVLGLAVGEGYDVLDERITVEGGYINDDRYYSLMADVDYVCIPYSEITYSGVLHDSMNLNKKVIGSELICSIVDALNINDATLELTKGCSMVFSHDQIESTPFYFSKFM